MAVTVVAASAAALQAAGIEAHPSKRLGVFGVRLEDVTLTGAVNWSDLQQVQDNRFRFAENNSSLVIDLDELTPEELRDKQLSVEVVFTGWYGGSGKRYSTLDFKKAWDRSVAGSVRDLREAHQQLEASCQATNRVELLQRTEIAHYEQAFAGYCKVRELARCVFSQTLPLGVYEPQNPLLDKYYGEDTIPRDFAIGMEGSDEVFKVHGFILSFRGVQFASDPMDNKDNGVTLNQANASLPQGVNMMIKSASADAVKDLIQFLYTQTFEPTDDDARTREVYRLASRYAKPEPASPLLGLKALCTAGAIRADLKDSAPDKLISVQTFTDSIQRATTVEEVQQIANQAFEQMNRMKQLHLNEHINRMLCTEPVGV